jgi:succinate dehydrogenase / fumarate reductase, membrane anchor subunit
MAGQSESTITHWWLQRVSACIIAVYAVLVIALLFIYGTPNAEQWRALFANNGFRVFTLLAMVATFYHGLIGVLHVWPDYVKDRALQATLNGYSWLATAGYTLWAVYILFGFK